MAQVIVTPEIPSSWISTMRYFPSGLSSFAVNGATATNPVQLFSTLRFPRAGSYNVSIDATLWRGTGGAGADTHACVGLSSITQTSFDLLPFMNKNLVSTFTTLNMNVNATSNALTRNLVFMDKSANAYTGVLSLGNPRIQYIQGI